MSWRIQAAVGRKSNHVADGVGKLLYRLAEYANEDGAIDPAPNQDTMASWYGVSTRTIRNWTNTLITSGELIQTRTGKGPGQTSAYQITLTLGDSELSPFPKQDTRKAIEERFCSIEETIAAFASSINERLSAIEDTLNEYRKEEETKAAFVSSITDRLDALEKRIPEKAERNTGNATRSNGHSIYTDLSNTEDTHPQTPSQNGNGRQNGNGVSESDLGVKLFWGDVLGLCQSDSEQARSIFYLADDLARELVWVKPSPGPSPSARDRTEAINGWWRPLVTVLRQCEGDIVMTKEILKNAVTAMRGRDMSPSRPQGVMGEVSKMLSADVSSANGNGAFHDPSWPEPNQGGTW